MSLDSSSFLSSISVLTIRLLQDSSRPLCFWSLHQSWPSQCFSPSGLRWHCPSKSSSASVTGLQNDNFTYNSKGETSRTQSKGFSKSLIFEEQATRSEKRFMNCIFKLEMISWANKLGNEVTAFRFYFSQRESEWNSYLITESQTMSISYEKISPWSANHPWVMFHPAFEDWNHWDAWLNLVKRLISTAIHCFSSHDWLCWKSTTGRIEDLGGQDPASRPYFGDPWLTHQQRKLQLRPVQY